MSSWRQCPHPKSPVKEQQLAHLFGSPCEGQASESQPLLCPTSEASCILSVATLTLLCDALAQRLMPLGRVQRGPSRQHLDLSSELESVPPFRATHCRPAVRIYATPAACIMPSTISLNGRCPWLSMCVALYGLRSRYYVVRTGLDQSIAGTESQDRLPLSNRRILRPRSLYI